MPQEQLQPESSFSGADKYQQLKAQQILDHEDRMRNAVESITDEQVDAQVEILNRLFAGKTEEQIKLIKAHSIQDNELNRRALEKQKSNVVELGTYRQEKGEEQAA